MPKTRNPHAGACGVESNSTGSRSGSDRDCRSRRGATAGGDYAALGDVTITV